MILRTPPPQRRKPINAPSEGESMEVSEAAETRPETSLVLYDNNTFKASHEHADDALVCTHQCRQLIKVEVVEMLDSKEKEVVELQNRVKMLDEVNKNYERDNKELQSRILMMEQELAAANGREKAVEERYTKDVKQFQEWLETNIMQCKDVEMKLQHETKLRVDAESSANAANDKVKMLEEKLEKTLKISVVEKNCLTQKLHVLTEDYELTIKRITAERDREACRANGAENEAQLLIKQYKELENHLSEMESEKNNLEKRLFKAMAGVQCSGTSESDTLVKNLQEELRHYEKEVAEARKIKKFHENSELLKEKILEEKQRADRAEAALESLSQYELKVANLENELKSWRTMIEGIPGARSCDDVLKKITDFQKEAMAGAGKVAELGMQLKKLEEDLDQAESKTQEANREVASLRKEKEHAICNIQRLERKVSLLRKECDGLKAILSSYDEEEVISAKRQKPDIETAEKTKNKGIQELEAALQDSQSNMRQLEEELENQEQIVRSQRLEIKCLQQKLDDSSRKIKSLERESDHLRSEVAMYESKLGHGDFNANTTKILRMVNMFGAKDQNEDRVESLRLELQKLQSRLKAFEQLKLESEDGDISGSVILEKFTELKSQVATLQKREERYKKVFAEKISVFRLACCSLFGYQIQMDEQQRPSGIPITLFTLQSIYAQNDDEKLEFEYDSGNMNILINDYAKQTEIERQIKVFIHKFNSISAFTANLTVELFNRSTMS